MPVNSVLYRRKSISWFISLGNPKNSEHSERLLEECMSHLKFSAMRGGLRYRWRWASVCTRLNLLASLLSYFFIRPRSLGVRTIRFNLLPGLFSSTHCPLTCFASSRLVRSFTALYDMSGGLRSSRIVVAISEGTLLPRISEVSLIFWQWSTVSSLKIS